jgi:hypothetical protein
MPDFDIPDPHFVAVIAQRTPIRPSYDQAESIPILT